MQMRACYMAQQLITSHGTPAARRPLRAAHRQRRALPQRGLRPLQRAAGIALACRWSLLLLCRRREAGLRVTHGRHQLAGCTLPCILCSRGEGSSRCASSALMSYSLEQQLMSAAGVPPWKAAGDTPAPPTSGRRRRAEPVTACSSALLFLIRTNTKYRQSHSTIQIACLRLSPAGPPQGRWAAPQQQAHYPLLPPLCWVRCTCRA